MCVSFVPTTKEQLKQSLQVDAKDTEWKTEVWQDYVSPIIVANSENKAHRKVLLAAYSMVPKQHIPAGTKRYSTMNARAETIGELRSYAKYWRECHLCLIPMTSFFEPNYESGKAERWHIGMQDNSPFAVAGIYRQWSEIEQEDSYSFTQITINADDHPLMKRFHKAGDEKRSLVIVPKEHYDDWLQCTNPEYARTFLVDYPAEKMKAWAIEVKSKVSLQQSLI